MIGPVIGERFHDLNVPFLDRHIVVTERYAQSTLKYPPNIRGFDQKATTYLGATAAFFPARPLAIMAVLAKAPLWVKALVEQAMEAAKATTNKVLLANMVDEQYPLVLVLRIDIIMSVNVDDGNKGKKIVYRIGHATTHHDASNQNESKTHAFLSLDTVPANCRS